MKGNRVTIVGGGLAGSEAAWQCARRGLPVVLHEMRPARPTPVHRTGFLGELVCSNSLKSDDPGTAHGLLKAELRRLGSLVLDCADAARLPAGAALAVDRERFAREITRRLAEHPLVEIRREEVTEIPADGPVILAPGPLCSDPLARAIARLTGEENLFFFDAISPVIEADSIDRSVCFAASRYGKGGGSDYLNCPLDREQYERFHRELVSAARVEPRDFERGRLFEGCLPIEELALRGLDTLRFGPLKPVGLVDPRTGKRPWAVVQLRQDNLAATHWSMVGFQTRLTWPEQKRVFRLVPGLERARFAVLGQMHRNTYVNAPRVLLPTFQARAREDVLLAGQVSGVEGYVESAASGLVAGLGAAALARGAAPPVFPPETAIGSLQRYVAGADPRHYQPVNVSFGLLPPLAAAVRNRRERKRLLVERALRALEDYLHRERSPGAAGGERP